MIRPGQSPETVFGENNNLPFADVGKWLITGAGMNKKSVVLIKDEKLCGVFPSIQMAGKMIGVAPSLISAICRKVRGKHTANGYRCFFEDSNDWYNLIKQDYE